MNRTLMVAIALVVLAAVGGGAFWAGTRVGENRAAQNPAQLFQQRAGREAGEFPGLGAEGLPGFEQGQEGQGILGRAGGGTMGTIEAIEGHALVLTTNDGTVRVLTADTTMVEKYMSVDVEELEVGERVIVVGSTNDDGTLAARSIQSMRALPSEMIGQE